MVAYKDRLNAAMDEAGVSTSELARTLGVSYQAVKKVRDGLSSQFNTDNNLTAAKRLGVNSDWLASGKGPKKVTADPEEPQPEYAGKPRPSRRVVVVGTAKLGDNGFYEEISSIPGAGDGHLDVASDDPNAYVLRVRGSSMAPAIRDGWYVLIEPNGRCAAGEPVLIKLRDGRKMVKEFIYERADAIEVLSVHGEHRITIYREELESMQPVAGIFPPSKWKPD